MQIHNTTPTTPRVSLRKERGDLLPSSEVNYKSKVPLGQVCTSGASSIHKLENVEHCGGEPEQADTASLLPN